jgi:hypothetical protein
LKAFALVEEMPMRMAFLERRIKDAVMACEGMLLRVAEERNVSVGVWSNWLRV